ncbi:TerD family protein [Nocardia blacklockiae]|uniref:TerD family protein n=1 Tax=Nocardia blacklockiae TaxID=480036 RepID=UPI00189475A5|nr:TerD family protein [Nocardia blacklockiae]MBF6172045.1 tellurium resistance TerZ family protein [Nocardia blacklockiae]
MLVPLQDDGGTPLEYLAMGLGWDPAPARRRFGARRPAIDLNASALLFDGDRLVDVVYHEQLGTADGSVRLHGDNVTGEGPGDDEVLTVDLTRLPDAVDAVVLLVTCYSDQTFDDIGNAYCRLADGVSGTEIARYNLPRGPHTGLVMGVLERATPAWQFRQVVAGIAARHPADAVPLLAEYLR